MVQLRSLAAHLSSMHQITIRPVHKLFQENPKPEVTVTEVNQLTAQINRQIARKAANPAQRASRRIEVKQLACIKKLMPLFSSRTRQAKTTVALRLDEILTQEGFKYESKKHPPASERRLLAGDDKGACYDLAFYSPAVSTAATSPGHHCARLHRRQRPALFYVRCEEDNKTLLIGNMQIDLKPRDLTRPDHLIMTAPKNIQLAMVHHAVRYGLKRGFAPILFQAGDSACQAQFNESIYRRVLITSANIAHYEAEYARRGAKAVETKPGDRCNLPYAGANFNYIVQRTTGTKIICGREDYSAYNLPDVIVHGLGHFPEIDEDMIRYKFGLERELAAGRPEKLLQYFEAFIAAAGLTSLDKISPAKKIADLKKIITQVPQFPGTNDYDRHGVALTKILIAWGYEPLLLKKFSGIERYVNARTHVPFYYDSNLPTPPAVIRKGGVPHPQVGKYYLTITAPTLGTLDRQFLRGDKNYQIFYWYECRLPELLRKLGLHVEKIALPGFNGAPPPGTTAWRIKGGQEDFSRRPLACF